jgi:hypothetical protein
MNKGLFGGNVCTTEPLLAHFTHNTTLAEWLKRKEVGRIGGSESSESLYVTTVGHHSRSFACELCHIISSVARIIAGTFSQGLRSARSFSRLHRTYILFYPQQQQHRSTQDAIQARQEESCIEMPYKRRLRRPCTEEDKLSTRNEDVSP